MKSIFYKIIGFFNIGFIIISYFFPVLECFHKGPKCHDYNSDILIILCILAYALFMILFGFRRLQQNTFSKRSAIMYIPTFLFQIFGIFSSIFGDPTANDRLGTAGEYGIALMVAIPLMGILFISAASSLLLVIIGSISAISIEFKHN